MQVTVHGFRDPRSCARVDRRVKESERRSDRNMEVGRGSNCEPYSGRRLDLKRDSVIMIRRFVRGE
jgi:hypothetical protein